MAFQPALAPMLNLAAGAVIAGFGVWLGARARWRPAAFGVATIAIAVGLIGVGQSVRAMNDAADALEATSAILVLAALALLGIGAFALWSSFPSKLVGSDRRILAIAAVTMLPFVWIAAFMPGLEDADAVTRLVFAIGLPAFAGYSGLLVVLALRHARAPTASERRDIRLATIALLPYFGANIASWLTNGIAPEEWAGRVALAAALVIVIVWLIATTRADPTSARNMALLTPGVLLAFLLAHVFTEDADATARLTAASARVWAVIVLSYAILRHQLLGLDVRVRWTIQRGTIGAVFLAVFLVATQVAENYLDAYGVLLGGVAAGLLLFFLGPIQRGAERLAQTAIPAAKRPADMTADERLAIYRTQAQIAWQDGKVDRKDREMLLSLRGQLGLSAEAAEAAELEAMRAAA